MMFSDLIDITAPPGKLSIPDNFEALLLEGEHTSATIVTQLQPHRNYLTPATAGQVCTMCGTRVVDAQACAQGHVKWLSDNAPWPLTAAKVEKALRTTSDIRLLEARFEDGWDLFRETHNLKRRLATSWACIVPMRFPGAGALCRFCGLHTSQDDLKPGTASGSALMHVHTHRAIVHSAIEAELHRRDY